METPPCHVVYVNRKVGQDRLIAAAPLQDAPVDDNSAVDWSYDQTREAVQPLLNAFGDVHVCTSGASCIAKLFELQDSASLDIKPTLVLLDTPAQADANQNGSRPSSSSHDGEGKADIHAPDEDVYGLNLLQKLITEAHLRGVSKLIVPVPIIAPADSLPSVQAQQMTDGPAERVAAPLGFMPATRHLVKRCLDLGAADVIISPLSAKCITSLEICAYRAHRDAAREQQAILEVRRGRKRSWVGVNEEKPFAYLREAMVSGLMNGICRLNTDDDNQLISAHIAVSLERQEIIAQAVGPWHFDAHEFTDDELVVAAMFMFKHALTVPELEAWRIPTDQLISFLVACRAAYNSFVPYHNFRHVIDVLQATFSFLVNVGALPQYPEGAAIPTSTERSPLATMIGPFEALTLLVTAIGHDVGHPGVNNGFLITLNAPLAQLYNDRSVLESFHCAAYSQILRRYWPAVFMDKQMRGLMISSILATDMGLHFDYMKKMGDLQEKLHENNSTDGWSGRQTEEYKALACALLIKCADISNVARQHNTAHKWMHILSEEFSRQASMEDELKIQSSLMAPPKKDPASLARAQLSFMNMFAIPLFQGVADVMPGMQYTVDELELNRGLFEQKVSDDREKSAQQLPDNPTRKRLLNEGTFSPRTMSFAAGAEPENKDKDSTEQDDDRSHALAKLTENLGATPTMEEPQEPQPEIMDKRDSQLSPPRDTPKMKPSHVPATNENAYKEVNGAVSPFDAVRELANSDPFHTKHDSKDSCVDTSISPHTGPRRSETTEGSASGNAGDWASQATSTTTGKMPLSPSTQGTSLVSSESVERQSSAAAGLHLSPSSAQNSSSTATMRKEPSQTDGESNSTASIGKADGKALKKRPSRFRMKDFPFFRKHHKNSSPSPSATDTAN
ncbi:3'5'-cyclic nucleotide phosphodiesterase domain-containing protein [Sarocladium implicatum]|nr:3'5'-cyclic nucleotide phosphodiesterase domain-containing protein [Sarocladium implicatum]